jgi:hypothetical protein
MDKVKRLFNEDRREDWTDNANLLSREVEKALRPVIERAFNEGYSMRDLHSIICHASLDLTLCSLMFNKEGDKPLADPPTFVD